MSVSLPRETEKTARREILCVARVGSLAAALFCSCFLTALVHSTLPFPPFPSLPSPSFPLSPLDLTSPLPPRSTSSNCQFPSSPLPPLCLSFCFVSSFFVVALTLSQSSKLFSYCIASSSVKSFFSLSLFLVLSLNLFTAASFIALSFSLHSFSRPLSSNRNISRY